MDYRIISNKKKDPNLILESFYVLYHNKNCIMLICYLLLYDQYLLSILSFNKSSFVSMFSGTSSFIVCFFMFLINNIVKC